MERQHMWINFITKSDVGYLPTDFAFPVRMVSESRKRP